MLRTLRKNKIKKGREIMELKKIIAVRTAKTIYKDGDAAVKVFDSGFSKANVLNEALNQARVEETELNIPKIRAVTMIDGKWAIVSDYIPGKTLEGDDFTPEHRSIPELLRLPGVVQVLVCFFCYCALESTAGMWAASYCTLSRGIDANTAAGWASTFYVGITIGRGVCGFLTMKLSDQNMIRLGQALIALGVVLILLPAGQSVLFVGLITVGLGCAPIYPCIIHETPANFGRSLSLAMTGIQMAFAYVGSCLMPPIFGLLAQYITPALYPWYLGVLLVIMFIMAESLHRRTRAKRESILAGE